MTEARPTSEPVPGGGRHRQHRRHSRDIDPQKPVLAILEVKQRTRLADHQPNSLAYIQGAAAAEGNDTVVTSGLVGCDAKHDVVGDGIGLNARIGHTVQARIRTQLNRVRHQRQLGETRIGNQQRPRACRETRQTSGSSRMRPAPKRIAVG